MLAFRGPDSEPFVIRTDVSQTEELRRGSIAACRWGWWLPDSAGALLLAHEKDGPPRSYVVRKDQEPRPFTPEGVRCYGPVSRHGWVACENTLDEQGRALSPVAWDLRNVYGGEPKPAPWMPADRRLIAWSPDGRYVFLGATTPLIPPLRVWRLDRASGRIDPWLDVSPRDRAGVAPSMNLNGAALTPDGRYYAYCYTRSLYDLFLVEGLK